MLRGRGGWPAFVLRDLPCIGEPEAFNPSRGDVTLLPGTSDPREEGGDYIGVIGSDGRWIPTISLRGKNKSRAVDASVRVCVCEQVRGCASVMDGG